MICGNFKATDRGFHGEIRFFGSSEKVEILRIDEKASDKSPDYRIVAADNESIEFGVGWLKSGRDGNGPRVRQEIGEDVSTAAKE